MIDVNLTDKNLPDYYILELTNGNIRVKFKNEAASLMAQRLFEELNMPILSIFYNSIYNNYECYFKPASLDGFEINIELINNNRSQFALYILRRLFEKVYQFEYILERSGNAL